jgi:membrane-bound metal-dependent hydrolase YbcI (DUF457 family)
MGRTHALSGAFIALLTGPTLGLDTYAEVLPFASLVAGYALLPDLDHPQATASRCLGPVTGAISTGLRAASFRLYTATKGPRDERSEGMHRHLTHTAAAAVVAGGLCWVTTSLLGMLAVAAWVGFGLLLAHDRLGRLALAAFGVGPLVAILGAGTDVVTAISTMVDTMSSWLWIAVIIGCLVHDVGDAITEAGCPILWPVPIAGETWYEIRPPSCLRFRTGKTVERWVMFPAFAAGCVLALPGMWSFLVDQVPVFVQASQ